MKAAVLPFLAILVLLPPLAAQDYSPRYFQIGTPTVTDIFVDPVRGSDTASGRSTTSPLRTIDAAWRAIPMGVPLTNGVRINLAPGTYPETSIPNYLESRYGTAAAPIIIRSRDTPGSAVLEGDLNIFDCRYLYLIGLTVRPRPAGDVLHCERCDHLLLRGSTFDGGGRIGRETIKINQSQNIFLENNNIRGASDNAIDFVAVQYGHIVGNRVSDAEDWCAYVKGGSAAIRVENNTFFKCGTGGFTAGQGTGFEFMEPPWIHYEAYDIKFFNNIVHDTDGAAIGVNGGFNILMAFNTFYRVGARSHGIEVVFGSRSCDGDISRCNAHRALSGWGQSSGEEPIPNRHVFIFNNVLYNPPGFRSADQHFAIYSPREPTSGSNIPSPARTDSGLMIRGNNIANGPSDLPLGIEGSEVCLDSNPSCSETQLRDDNSINQGIPLLRDPSRGDFRPDPSGDILTGTAILIPDFTDIGRPQSPAVPTGILTNMFPEDRGGTPRHSSSPPGAYSTSTSPLERPMEDSSIPETPGDDSLRTPPDIRISRLRIRRVTDRRVRLSVTALCLSDTESITRVRGSFAARGSKLKTYAMRAIGNSSYRGVLTTRTNASRAVVSIRATTSSGASRIKRRNLRLPRF